MIEPTTSPSSYQLLHMFIFTTFRMLNGGTYYSTVHGTDVVPQQSALSPTGIDHVSLVQSE